MSSMSSSSVESLPTYQNNQSLQDTSLLPVSHGDIRSNNNTSGDKTVNVVFTCQIKSHPFQERHVVLQEGVANCIKIGRLVAKIKPTATNAIFDCKVLSRNHAVMWLEEGRVWLKDTKSSNGTFVNSQRLAKSSEESPPREIVSGDIVQFGVEVVENHVTHDCIVSQITIYDSSGKELRKTESVREEHAMHSSQSQEQIFQLSYYLGESLLREKSLERKLEAMEAVLLEVEESAQHTWQVLLNEDRLLSKLQSMQQQLDIFSADYSADTLQMMAVKAIEEKEAVRVKTTEVYDALLTDKAQALEEMRQAHTTSSEECLHLRMKFQEIENNWKQLSEQYHSRCRDLEAVEGKLRENDEAHNQTVQDLRTEHEAEIQKWHQRVDELEVNLKEMQADRDHVVLQVEELTARVAGLQRDRETAADLTDDSGTALKPQNKTVSMTEEQSCNTENDPHWTSTSLDISSEKRSFVGSIELTEEKDMLPCLQECIEWMEQDVLLGKDCPKRLLTSDSLHRLHQLLRNVKRLCEEHVSKSSTISEDRGPMSEETSQQTEDAFATMMSTMVHGSTAGDSISTGVLHSSTAGEDAVADHWRSQVLGVLQAFKSYLHRQNVLNVGTGDDSNEIRLDDLAVAPVLKELVELLKNQIDALVESRTHTLASQTEAENALKSAQHECVQLREQVGKEQERLAALEIICDRRTKEIDEVRGLLSTKTEETRELQHLMESSHARCMKLEEHLLEEQTLRQELQVALAARNASPTPPPSPPPPPETTSISTNTSSPVLVVEDRGVASETVSQSDVGVEQTSAEVVSTGSMTDEVEEKQIRDREAENETSTQLSDVERRLARQARLISALAVVPLMVLLLAVMVSLFMWLQSPATSPGPKETR